MIEETLKFEIEETAENYEWVRADEYYEFKKLGLIGEENE